MERGVIFPTIIPNPDDFDIDVVNGSQQLGLEDASCRPKAQTDVSDSSVNQTQEGKEKDSTTKWHSVWDITSGKEKKKKKKHRHQLAQGIKDFMTVTNNSITSMVTSGDFVTTPSPRFEKRDKPKRPPPPVIKMSEVKDRSEHPEISLNPGFDQQPVIPSTGAKVLKSPLSDPGPSAIKERSHHKSSSSSSSAIASRVPKAIAEIPKLPRGKKLIDTVVQKDVDSLYRSIFENETFFEIVTKKTYDEVRSFRVTPWAFVNGDKRRKMAYEFPKTIAFTRQEIKIEQVQTVACFSTPGRVYGVDCVTQNSGVMYSDYFEINLHYRLTADDSNLSRVVVIGDIVFVKPCLFKSRIEAETWSGLKKYYEMMEIEVQLERKDLNDESMAVTSEDVIDNVPNMTTIGTSQNKQGIKRQAPRIPSTAVSGSPFSTLIFGDQTISIAFLMIIFILLIITLALFRLAGAIAALSDRLEQIEDVLERYALVCVEPPGKDR